MTTTITPRPGRIKLKEARRAAGLTQKALGRKVGITAAYVCQIERGQRTPPADLAVAIARAVGGHVEDFFSDNELNNVSNINEEAVS